MKIYTGITLIFCLTFMCCLYKKESNISPYAKTGSNLLRDSIRELDFYCFCCRATKIFNPTDTTPYQDCTTSVNIEPELIIRPSYLVASIKNDTVFSSFKKEFGLNEKITIDTVPGILLDARLVLLISYKNSPNDTIVVNGSGRVILNRKYVIEYGDFYKKLEAVFK